MKFSKIASFISGFLGARIISTVPPGIKPDNMGMWALYGFMQNANAYASTEANVTTAGTNSTLTGAQAVAGALILASGATGGFTITLPTTAALLTALGDTIPKDGTFSKILRIKNSNVGQTGTLTAGDASTTVSGTATIATNTTRSFLLTVESGGTTITIENFGSMSL